MGVFVPAAPNLADNSLLAADEGVAGLESAFALLVDVGAWPMSVVPAEPGT